MDKNKWGAYKYGVSVGTAVSFRMTWEGFIEWGSREKVAEVSS